MKLLDPRSKIEDLKEQFRDALLQRVLKENSSELEGYDLLEKAISNRTNDPKAKETIYLCLRQLRRNYQQIEIDKQKHEQRVDRAYNNYFNNLVRTKNDKIRWIDNSAVTPAVKASLISDLKSKHRKDIDAANIAKNETMERAQDAYENAINGLEKQYQDLLNGLGAKQGFARALEIGEKGGRAIGWGLNRAFEMGKWARAQF